MKFDGHNTSVKAWPRFQTNTLTWRIRWGWKSDVHIIPPPTGTPSLKSHVETWLVGGWTNPFQKYARQIGNLPQIRSENEKIFELPPTRWHTFWNTSSRNNFQAQPWFSVSGSRDGTSGGEVGRSCGYPSKIPSEFIQKYIPGNFLLMGSIDSIYQDLSCVQISATHQKKMVSSLQSPWQISFLWASKSKSKRKMWTKKKVKRLVDSFLFLFQHIGACSVFTNPTGICWTRKWGGHIPDCVEVVKISKACWATGKCFTVSPDYLRLSCHPLDLNKFPKSPSQIKWWEINKYERWTNRKRSRFFLPAFFYERSQKNLRNPSLFLDGLEESATLEVSTSPEGRTPMRIWNTPWKMNGWNPIESPNWKGTSSEKKHHSQVPFFFFQGVVLKQEWESPQHHLQIQAPILKKAPKHYN